MAKQTDDVIIIVMHLIQIWVSTSHVSNYATQLDNDLNDYQG